MRSLGVRCVFIPLLAFRTCIATQHCRVAICEQTTTTDVLGNTYITYFFKISRDLSDLDKAIQAYDRSEANGGDNNPDLFFNRGRVYQFKEDFSKAVGSYKKVGS